MTERLRIEDFEIKTDARLVPYGRINLLTRTVTVNVWKHDLFNEPIFNTLAHEEIHAEYPSCNEREAEALAKAEIEQMTPSKIRHYYNVYKRLGL